MRQYEWITEYPNVPPGMRISETCWLNRRWPEGDPYHVNRGFRRRHWTDGQLDLIKKMTEDGDTYNQIAKELGCTDNAVEWCIKQILKIPKPDPKAPGVRITWRKWWTSDRRQFLIDNYFKEHKMSQEQIGHALGCSQKKVSLAVRDIREGQL